jgi:hypothetical protein
MTRACFACLSLFIAGALFGQSNSVPFVSQDSGQVERRVQPLHPRPLPWNEYRRKFPGKARGKTRPFVPAPSPIFYEAPTYSSGGEDAESLAAVDVNGDGKLDLLVANGCSDSGCTNHGSVGVLLGNGDGTFQPAVTYDSGGYSASAIAVVDVNGDGKPDLIVANECNASSSCTTGSVGVLLGNGDGTFQPALNYALSFPTNGVAAADVNGDGKVDLLVADTNGFEVLLITREEVTRADMEPLPFRSQM